MPPSNPQDLRSDQSWSPNLGFQFLYRADTVNRCPGCGKRHWYVGRLTAECAFCHTALPLEQAYGADGSPRFSCRGRDGHVELVELRAA